MVLIYNYNLDTNRIETHKEIKKDEITNKLKKKDIKLLFDEKKFKNVNTYIIKEKFILFKINGIRCILSNSDIWFFTFSENEFTSKIYKQINKEYLEQFNSNFILSSLELIIDILIKEGENKVNNFNSQFDTYINRNYKNSMNKFKDLYLVNIKTNESYELYSDIIELLQYLLENEDDINEILKLIKNNNSTENDKNYSEEIDSILENGINIMKDIINEFKNVKNKIDNYKNITEIELDSLRNNVAILTFNIEFFSLIFSFGAFVSSVFGMNLSNEMEDIQGGAYILFSIILLFMLLMSFVYFIKYKDYIGVKNDLTSIEY